MPEELPVSAYLTKLSALLLKTSEAPINNERVGINKSITIEFNTKENAKKTILTLLLTWTKHGIINKIANKEATWILNAINNPIKNGTIFFSFIKKVEQ